MRISFPLVDSPISFPAKQRDTAIDVLKSFGILCVIMGHTGSPFYLFIYAFHMGLFFWCSGYLFLPRSKQSIKTAAHRAFQRNIIPYLCFWLISFVLIELRSYHSAGLLIPITWAHIRDIMFGLVVKTGVNTPLWYLHFNFFATVLLALFLRMMSKCTFTALGGGGGMCVTLLICIIGLMACSIPFQSIFPDASPLNAGVLPVALVYMLLGYLAALHQQYFPANPFIGGLLVALGFNSFCGGNVAWIPSLQYYLSSLLTIGGLYLCAKCIPHRYTGIFTYISQRTLYILGLHILLQDLGISRISDYTLATFGITNEAIINTCASLWNLACCCGAADIYLALRTCIHKRIKQW